KLFRFVIKKFSKIQRGKVTGRVIKEHVLAAGIRSSDTAAFRAGMPLINGAVVLKSWVGAAPGGSSNFIPQFFGCHRFYGLTILTRRQVPVAVCFQNFEKRIGNANGV